MVLAVMLVVGVPILYGISSTRSGRTPNAVTRVDATAQTDGTDERTIEESGDPTANLLVANPMTHYFGVPLSGKTIGYVVDGDATMAPYIDNVATLTNSVNEAIEKGTRRFGVMLAVSREGHTFVEVAEPSNDLEGARSVLLGRLVSGRTDLGKALSVASNWYADQIFLVLSKPVDDRQMEVLKQGAEQTSAVVHVIALGGAARQDLSPIAAATGGTFIPVTDDALRQLIDRQKEAKAARL